MSKKTKSYSIGLDIGTNSVGWAVTDSENNLLKFKEKNMWGVRLFESGETAVNRRVFRSTRRRLARRKQRIKLLQELMSQMVLGKDESFFIRLKESMLHLEDRVTNKEKSNLFVGDFTDKDYYDKYQTIYHLRNELINSTEKMDPRLIYLAMHNIIKYRGHFLHDGEFEVSENGLEEDLKELVDAFNDQLELDLGVPIKKTVEILNNRQLKKGERIDAVTQLWNRPKAEKDFVKNLLSLFVGNKGTLSKVFIGHEIIGENDKELSISLADSKFEELEESILNQLEDNANLLELIKKVYSGLVLFEVLNGEKFISKAMVNSYEKHKADLIVLKRLFKAEFPKSYFHFFREESDGKNYVKNYLNYINGEKRCNQEDLYKALKLILQEKEDVLIENDDFRYCMEEMERNNFLLKQNSKANASIPHQLGKYELEKIIDNQSDYYPELKINKEKILLLLTFRIPYYVGPLNQESSFGWIEKIEGRESERILPWNFEEIVDVDLTAEKFIERMRNFCTYLPSEEVLPKYSLVHSKFQLLNELNGIKVDGKRIPNDVKKNLLQGLFLSTQSVKNKRLIAELKKFHYEAKKITGNQKEEEFANSLASEIKFNQILGEEYVSNNLENVEEIIKWLALFEDRKILKRKIKQKYPEITAEQIEKISKLNFKGWARLSKKLIDGIKFENQKHEKRTIVSIMEDTNENFMQIINNEEYGFDEIIEGSREKNEGLSIQYDDIKNLACSPAIKRGIWQTVGIVKEIVKVMQHEPTNIYLEFARDNQESRRTNSRFKQMDKLYQTMKEDVSFFNKDIFSELKSNKDKLDSEKMYLYFTQNGKCMYSGEPLEISNLSFYEVDHIIPRTLIKDDSIENKVLVKKIENQRKSDGLVLEDNIRKFRKDFWNNLYKHKLIGNKKYNNLNRNHFDEKDVEGFINRQLVETRQISKNVAVLFQDAFLNTKINTVKAQMSSDFRKQFDLYKLREVNDFHHAHDAYLASIIGNYTKRRFPKIENEIVYSDYLKFGKDSKTKKGKFGFVVTSMMKDYIDVETGEIIWKSEESISKIRKALFYKDCFVTKKLEENTGEFNNQTIYPAKEGLIKLKDSSNHEKMNLNTEKYGGYSGQNKAYTLVYEGIVGGKKVRDKIGIPIKISSLYEDDEIKMCSYIEAETGIDSVKILKKISKNQLAIIKGSFCFITSDNELNNATQLVLSEKHTRTLSKVLKTSTSELDFNNEEFSLEIDAFFKEVLVKVSGYYSIYSRELEKLELYYNEKFTTISIQEKIEFIREFIKLTQANASNPNLKKFKFVKDNKQLLSDRFGRKSSGFSLNDAIFIDQSITGMYEKRYSFKTETDLSQ